MSAVVGPRHPAVQRLRRLSRRRAARLEEDRFVIDGPTLVAEALQAGVTIEELLTTGDHPELEAKAAAAGATVQLVASEVLARAADTVTSQGVAAVAHRVEMDLDGAIERSATGPITVVLVDVSDPGNAGTMLRTAEASGAAAVLFCGSSVDPSNPKCVRASAGALFHVPVAWGGDVAGVLDRLGDVGLHRVATSVDGGTAYDSFDFDRPVAVVLGSEAHGLPSGVAAAVDEVLTIPMAGRSESLNVAMAGAVLCFEALRQRRLRETT